MNNKNKILIGCLALLLVMSIGYALFSDTITINGTATAKGEFSLTTTCDMDEEALEAVFVANSGSVTDAKITCENNVVNASAILDYPGSHKWFRVMVKNTGTIPAKLKKVVELNNPEIFVCKKDNCSNYITNIKSNVDDTNVVTTTLYPDSNWQIGYSDEPYGYEETFSEGQLDVVLDPEETAYFYIEMYWDYISTTPGEPLTAEGNFEIIWEQVTN